MNTKPKQNGLKILRAERDMAKTKLSGQPSFASLLSPNDKMRQRHIPVRDANRYAQSHNPQVATKLEPLPVLQGYPRAEFHSLNFPSACLRKTGARNKTSIGNFFPPLLPTSPIFRKHVKRNDQKCQDDAFLIQLPLSRPHLKRREEEGGGVISTWVHLNLMERCAHTRTL